MASRLTIDPALLVPHPDTTEASCCFVAYSPEIEAVLLARYGRQGLCLKVFPPDKQRKVDTNGQPREFWRFENVEWTKVSLAEASEVQNLFALHGIAPRAYDIVWVNGEQAAQVTDFLTDNGRDRQDELWRRLVDQYVIETMRNLDVGERNWIGGKMFDYGAMCWADREAYLAELTEEAYTRRGKRIGSSYQPVDGLEMRGRRDIGSRVKKMRLDDVDFDGATVLDIGCNLGAFCREAHDRGALRVVGIDRREIPMLAGQVNNLLGYWNLDIVQLKLKDGLDNRARIVEAGGIEQYDVVFCMAVVNYFGGYDAWIADLCRGVLYLEGHGGEAPERYWAALNRDFERVEFLGMTDDNYVRPLFRCWK